MNDEDTILYNYLIYVEYFFLLNTKFNQVLI